jgi:hypothetical protein
MALNACGAPDSVLVEKERMGTDGTLNPITLSARKRFRDDYLSTLC